MGKTYKDSSKWGKGKPKFPRVRVDWNTGEKVHIPKTKKRPKYDDLDEMLLEEYDEEYDNVEE